MNAKETFMANAYERMTAAIDRIPAGDRSDVYAISFFHYADDDDLRWPKLTIGYNTNAQYRSSIGSASSDAEAKWNFAFWLQNNLAELGGDDDPHLKAWCAQTPYYYTDEQNEKAKTDRDLFDELIEKDGQFDAEFIEAVIMLTQRLFREGVIRRAFEKEVPVLIHELEYYHDPVSWTLRANPQRLADEFAKWAARSDL
jgi:hypothetical protein